MWDNYRLLNILASGLFTLVVLTAAAAISPSVINLPVFALKEINITGTNKTDGRLKYITREQIRSLVSSKIDGSFFTVELDAIGNAFEKLPWVRAVSVRRNWPHGLEIELEEQVVLARRENLELVNIYGEVFEYQGQVKLLR